jgi:hypothetical protein
MRGDRERFRLARQRTDLDSVEPATPAPTIRATDVSISAESIEQNWDRRHAANTAIPPELALNPAH